MKIGWLSSYNTKCGISEYSRYLVSALRKREDVDIVVFGSKNYDNYKVSEDASYVLPAFGILPWNKYGDHSFEVEKILAEQLDVLHIQYESILYNQEGLYSLLEQFSGIKAITYHDNCIAPHFPYYKFDIAYTHREDVGVGEGYVLPMGVENRRPAIKTFGLGRSRTDIIEPICERNGWDFQYSFGEKDWIDQEVLYRWLRDSDAIVLYYDDAGAAGSSIAARVAISTRRPVIVNNVTWFKDLEETRQLIRVKDQNELELALQDLLTNHEITTNSWDVIAATLIQDYTKCLDSVH